MSSNWIRAFCVNTSPSTYTRKEQTYCPPLRDVQQEPRVTGGGRIMCADQMCDQHHLSQERTQEAATKTGASVTSGSTEGLLSLCLSGQKTRTMFNEKGKAKRPARIQEAQEEAGLPGRGCCFCFSGSARGHCPTSVPRYSILEKLKSQIIKPFTPAEEWKVAASVVSQKHVGTARRERAATATARETPHPASLQVAGPGRWQRDTAQEPLC